MSTQQIRFDICESDILCECMRLDLKESIYALEFTTCIAMVIFPLSNICAFVIKVLKS